MPMRYNVCLMSAFTSIQTVIKDFSKGSTLGLKLSEGQLQQEWENLVGITIAKHSYPESLRFKKLYLVADNSIWLQQLRFLKPAILEAIHSFLPDLSLSDVILRIGTVPTMPLKSNPTLFPTPEPLPQPSPFSIELAQRLRNPELQTLLSQTITKATLEPPPTTTKGTKKN